MRHHRAHTLMPQDSQMRYSAQDLDPEVRRQGLGQHASLVGGNHPEHTEDAVALTEDAVALRVVGEARPQPLRQPLH